MEQSDLTNESIENFASAIHSFVSAFFSNPQNNEKYQQWLKSQRV